MKITSILLLALGLTFASMMPVQAKQTQLAEQTAEQNVQVVNINKASAKELATMLKGIGLRKAEAIVDYRDANGPFESVEQLARVKGIGVATIAKNHTKIVL